MASPLRSSSLLLVAVVLFSALLLGAAPASASSRLNSTSVPDAENDKEMGDLGRFSVDEYNERREDESAPTLAFAAVKQADVKENEGEVRCYLQVAALVQGGVSRTFNAVVSVKPDGSRDLVTFEPSNSGKAQEDGQA